MMYLKFSESPKINGLLIYENPYITSSDLDNEFHKGDDFTMFHLLVESRCLVVLKSQMH